MLTPKLRYSLQKDGSAVIALAEAVQCGCGKMAMICINRDGKTRCVECDLNYRTEKETSNALR